MNRRPISLSQLTDQQAEMLSILWSLQDLADVEAWQSTLTTAELELSEVLMQLIILETADEIIADDVGQAREYLRRFQL